MYRPRLVFAFQRIGVNFLHWVHTDVPFPVHLPDVTPTPDKSDLPTAMGNVLLFPITRIAPVACRPAMLAVSLYATAQTPRGARVA